MRTATNIDRCLTIIEVASRLRIGEGKVREMIRKGLLGAIDIGVGAGRTQYRIRPEALEELERRLAVQPRQPFRRRRTEPVDAEIEAILNR